jgi:hypothetical protein
MTRIQRFLCGVVMVALPCLLVITVFGEDDPFSTDSEPVAGAASAAARPAEPSNDAAIRKTDVAAELSADDVPPRWSFCRCAGQGSPAAVARIEHALNAPLASHGLDFAETPLEEVVNNLQDEYRIPLRIKSTTLEESGLDPSEPVTVNLHNISLRSALRLMLEPLQLTYTVRDEVVEITTYNDANSNPLACVYNVRPFLGDDSGESMNALVETIKSCINTDSWSENGEGKAAIRALKPGLLVISQTQRAHDEIASLFRAIQKMREKSEGDGVGGGD